MFSNRITRNRHLVNASKLGNNTHRQIQSQFRSDKLFNSSHSNVVINENNHTIRKQSYHSSKHVLSSMMKDEDSIILGLQGLALISPSKVITSIENGWKNGNLPISDRVLKEYLKAVVKVNKLDALDIKGLLQFINEKEKSLFKTSSVSIPLTATAASSLNHSSMSMNMNNPNSNNLSPFLTKNAPGMTPTDPLYMATVEPSARSQSWKFFSKVALWFIALSFIGAVLDEKTGGAGGISSRLTGLSSIVHQAEQSDK